MRLSTVHRPSASLFDQLDTERQRRFVGRAAECEVFRAAILAETLPFHLLYVYGADGIGKTTLLTEFARLCRHRQSPLVYLDAHTLTPTAVSVLYALQTAFERDCSAFPLVGGAQLEGSSGFQSPFARKEDEPRVKAADVGERVKPLSDNRLTVFIDGYEALGAIDDWMRETCLPQFPANTLIVLAGRQPLGINWRTDLGWQPLTRVLSLRNFSPSESQRYLEHRHIPSEQHQAVLAFTNGHPLALSLVADAFEQDRISDFQPEALPDVIQVLLSQLVRNVPSPAHRMALEACAVVHYMTEGLLIAMLGSTQGQAAEGSQGAIAPERSTSEAIAPKKMAPDSGTIQIGTDYATSVHALFAWLRGLSFISSGRLGLFPNDLAREVMTIDLRWRHPDWYAELHQRARNYYMQHLEQAQGQDYQSLLADAIFLHRHHTCVRNRFTWDLAYGLTKDILRDGDQEALLAMVANHEGENAANVAAFWLQRQPQSVQVIRNGARQMVGFSMLIALHQAEAEALCNDPVAAAAWQHLTQTAPLRQGEQARLCRFWMAQDSYQSVSPVQSLLFVNLLQHCRITPGLAFTFLPCAEPQFWADLFEYAALSRLPAMDFLVRERCYGMYGHDWRTAPFASWLARLTQKEMAHSMQRSPVPLPTEMRVVLNQDNFAIAVREAFRYFCFPEKLRQNPLLRSRLVGDQVTDQGCLAQRAIALQTLIKDAVGSLRDSARTDKLHAALYRTYINPAPSQEQAAELLDLPFGTYRRYLKVGMMRVTEHLWKREIG